MKKVVTFLLILSMVFGMFNNGSVNANDDIRNEVENNNENIDIIKEDLGYNDLIDYIYIQNPIIQQGKKEIICIKIKDNFDLNNIYLEYKYDIQKYKLNEIKNEDGIHIFSIDALDVGKYTLEKIYFNYNNRDYNINLTEKREFSFNVEEIVQEDAEVQQFLDDTSENSISTYQNVKTKKGKYVICIDPGHDNKHTGAHNENTGIYEEKYTLDIAKACREELQTYNNVEVVMSRGDDGNCPYPDKKSGECNENRVKAAKEAGADYYIALHLNSGASSASGAEVYVSNYSKYHDDAAELANSILSELTSLGLPSRGVKVRNTEETDDIYYPDGTIKDYYGLIRNGVIYGVNSMIVEHGFIDNIHDANIIKNQYKEIGKADALGIAKRLGLTKRGVFSFSSSLVETNEVTVMVDKSYIDSKYDKAYKLIGYNVEKGLWESLTEYSNNTSFKWTPKEAGQYIFAIRAKSSSGEEKDYAIWQYEMVDSIKVKIHSVLLENVENKDLEYNIIPNISKNVNNLTYEFLVYDISQNQWYSIQKSDKETAKWIPKKSGEYLVGVRTTDLKGHQEENFSGYRVEKGKVQINAFTTNLQSPQTVNTKILLNADITKLEDEAINYEFLVYNDDKLTSISKNSGLKNIEWTPEKPGSYTLCFRVKTTTNNVYESKISYEINKKTQFISLNGFTWNYLENEIQIGVAYTTNDKAKFTWKSYDLDKQQWKTIAENTSSNWISWKPSKGNYWIYVEAKTSDGTTQDKTMCFSVGKDYGTQRISLNGFTWNYLENEIQIGVAYTTNDKAKFTWKSYDLDKQQWKTIAENTSSNWISWKPSKGNYWIYVEAKTSDGTTQDKTMCFSVGKDYGTQRISLNGFTWNYLENEIQIGVAYTTNDKAKFTWKSYDLDKQQWKTIAENTSSNWISWKPSKGNYWIYVEAKTSDGTTQDKTMCFSVGKDYNILKINGINIGELREGNIKLSADVTSNDRNLEYVYKAYCTNGEKHWYEIGQNGTGVLNWSPKEEGDYLLVLEVKDSSGATYTYNMGCSVKGNVDSLELKADKNGNQAVLTNILLTGKSKINGIGKYTHRMMVYDGTWELLAEDFDDFSTNWQPTKAGNYLLCYQIISPLGKEYNTFISFNITPLHEIMGNNSTTVSKMVNLYKKNNSKYDVYSESIYNGCLTQGGAPNIETFCQIFYEEAQAEGVRVEVAFAQAMLETGYLKFGGDVKPNQYNFAGLGATGGVPGNDFVNVRTGIRAQIQHLKCYASTEKLNNECVDKRWSEHLRGKAKYIEYLSIPSNPYGVGWAGSPTYGQDIIRLLKEL